MVLGKMSRFSAGRYALRVILTLLRTLRPQQTLDRPEDLSECGLDAPAASLTATAPDGGVLTIAMGNATTDGNSRYADINSDSEHIYIISGDLYTAMQTPVYEMVPPAGAANAGGGADALHHPAGAKNGAGGH